MSRHNRRRNRGGHKSGISSHSQSYDNLSLSSATIAAIPPSQPSRPPLLQATFSSNKPNNVNRRNGPSARHWHNRYTAWQARDHRHRQEKASLEAEKKRIFGDLEEGEDSNGEDEMLCEKMLEYFVGLDFIDT